MNLLRNLLLCLGLSGAALALAGTGQAATLGDDGLHKAPWMVETFKDLREDMAEAAADDRRLLLLIEQRGCIYCTRMHEEVFARPEIAELLAERFFVVQVNMFGDVEVTDLDGEVLPEKDMVRRWGLLFTPTMIFLPPAPEDIPEGRSAAGAAVATMPGAFGPATTRHLLEWVLEAGYDSDEPFQKYHARQLEAEANAQ